VAADLHEEPVENLADKHDEHSAATYL